LFDGTATISREEQETITRAVIQQGYRVIYREAHTLLEELADATLDGTRKVYLADLAALRSKSPILLSEFMRACQRPSGEGQRCPSTPSSLPSLLWTAT
jgi:hypothetical protein